MKLVHAPASSRLKPRDRVSPKDALGIVSVRRSLLALVGRKHTVVSDQLSPQNPPGSSLSSSSGSSIIESPSALAESY